MVKEQSCLFNVHEDAQRNATIWRVKQFIVF